MASHRRRDSASSTDSWAVIQTQRHSEDEGELIERQSIHSDFSDDESECQENCPYHSESEAEEAEEEEKKEEQEEEVDEEPIGENDFYEEEEVDSAEEAMPDVSSDGSDIEVQEEEDDDEGCQENCPYHSDSEGEEEQQQQEEEEEEQDEEEEQEEQEEDEVSVVDEDEVLSDPEAAGVTPAEKTSRVLDKLNECLLSPFERTARNIAEDELWKSLSQSVRITIGAAIAFYAVMLYLQLSTWIYHVPTEQSLAKPVEQDWNLQFNRPSFARMVKARPFVRPAVAAARTNTIQATNATPEIRDFFRKINLPSIVGLKARRVDNYAQSVASLRNATRFSRLVQLTKRRQQKKQEKKVDTVDLIQMMKNATTSAFRCDRVAPVGTPLPSLYIHSAPTTPLAQPPTIVMQRPTVQSASRPIFAQPPPPLTKKHRHFVKVGDSVVRRPQLVVRSQPGSIRVVRSLEVSVLWNETCVLGDAPLIHPCPSLVPPSPTDRLRGDPASIDEVCVFVSVLGPVPPPVRPTRLPRHTARAIYNMINKHSDASCVAYEVIAFNKSVYASGQRKRLNKMRVKKNVTERGVSVVTAPQSRSRMEKKNKPVRGVRDASSSRQSAFRLRRAEIDRCAARNASLPKQNKRMAFRRSLSTFVKRDREVCDRREWNKPRHQSKHLQIACEKQQRISYKKPLPCVPAEDRVVVRPSFSVSPAPSVSRRPRRAPRH